MDNLKNLFGKQKIDQNKKTEMVQDIFSDISENYNLMNDLMSFGMHRIWKKKLVEIINVQKNDQIIDIGSGTGDLIKLINNINKNVFMTSTDLNYKMLEYNKKKNNARNNKVKWVNCNAENLPFKNNTFDKYVISFCLRNITYINKGLSEAYRVLKPGGMFCCLEFSSPQTNLINYIYNLYKKNIIPLIGEKVTKNKNAYRYLEQSIDNFPNQEIFLSNLKKIGFSNVSYINLFNGIVAIHKGFKV